MISTETLKAADTLVAAIPLLGNNPNEKDYRAALELVEELLLENPQSPLLEIVCARIAAYENSQPDVRSLREEMDSIPPGIAILRTLMDQHNLSMSDFAEEIGGKSMVSRVLKGERQLTLNHIRKLAKRFNIPPSVFIG